MTKTSSSLPLITSDLMKLSSSTSAFSLWFSLSLLCQHYTARLNLAHSFLSDYNKTWKEKRNMSKEGENTKFSKEENETGNHTLRRVFRTRNFQRTTEKSLRVKSTFGSSEIFCRYFSLEGRNRDEKLKSPTATEMEKREKEGKSPDAPVSLTNCGFSLYDGKMRN